MKEDSTNSFGEHFTTTTPHLEVCGGMHRVKDTRFHGRIKDTLTAFALRSLHFHDSISISVCAIPQLAVSPLNLHDLFITHFDCNVDVTGYPHLKQEITYTSSIH